MVKYRVVCSYAGSLQHEIVENLENAKFIVDLHYQKRLELAPEDRWDEDYCHIFKINDEEEVYYNSVWAHEENKEYLNLDKKELADKFVNFKSEIEQAIRGLQDENEVTVLLNLCRHYEIAALSKKSGI